MTGVLTHVEVAEYPLCFEQDADAWVRFVQYETERIRAYSNDPNAGGRPEGLRLSTPCAVRRVKEYYDRDRYGLPIDPLVASRGLEMESRFRAFLPHLISAWQPVIAWRLGVSAYDFHDPDGVVNSLKSAKDHRRPQAAYLEQEMRMLANDDQPVGTRFNVWVIDPTAPRTWGPFEYRLTSRAQEAALQETDACECALNALSAATSVTDHPGWDEHSWWAEQGLECSCGGCLRHEPLDADPTTEKRAAAWGFVKDQLGELERQADWTKAALVEAARDRLQAAGDRENGKVRAYMAPWQVSVKDGRARVTRCKD